MAYSNPDDLLTGSMTVSPEMASQITDMAASDMDAELGLKFELPLVTDEGSSTLPVAVTAILAKCNRLIASGRFILSRHGSVDDNLHVYGTSLLTEGQTILADIVSGAIPLRGVKIDGPQGIGDDGGNAPSLYQHDPTSGVDAFSAWLNEPQGATPSTPGDPWWKPGY